MPSPEMLVMPPTDGSMLLPETFAFHRKNNGDASVYIYMEDDAHDIAQITYEQLDKACNRVARSIGADVDSSTRPVVGLVALSDTLVYQTTVAGIMLAGCIPFLISPRNTAATIINLLMTTSCQCLVATCSTLRDLLCNIKRELGTVDPAYTLVIKEAPTFHDLFSGRSGEETSEEFVSTPKVSPPSVPTIALDDIALYLHSSGSTGYPKAIPKTHRTIIEYVNAPCCAIFRQSRRPRMPGMQLPPFHALGIVMGLFLPMFSCVSVVFYPPVIKSPEMVPPLVTSESLLRHVKKTACNSIAVIPSFLQDWANDPRALDVLRSLELVVYSGGALSRKVGDFFVAQGVCLKTIYGSTETGGPAFSSQRAGDEQEWEYVEFSDSCNVIWVPHDDETYECHLLTTPDYHPSVCNSYDAKGYTTSDLFKQHPHKDYLWKMVGRLDDMIVHTSGEKTLPLPMEGVIMGSPHVMGAVVFGQGHDQAGVLIEYNLPSTVGATDLSQRRRLLDLVWPAIEEANLIAPAFSRIYKEMVLFTDGSKPLPRAPKGTVVRKLALRLYEDEIKTLYASRASGCDSEPDYPRTWNRLSLIEWLHRQTHDLCSGNHTSMVDNLFEVGLDSLGAAILRRRIIGVLKASTTEYSAQKIAHNVVYTHPSIEALADHLMTLGGKGLNSVSFSVESRVREIEDMIRKYQFTNLTMPMRHKPKSTTILITGSTGHLGSNILERVLQDSRIFKVYTLNRPSSPGGPSIKERHLEQFRDHAFNEDLLLSKKLTHFESNMSEDKLGLPESVYLQLRDCVTVIIHAAWRLDFNLPLASFEAQIRGTHNLIALSRSMEHAASVKFLFTSSVSTAQAWDRAVGLYPETIVLDTNYAVGLGYGESKYVTERILASSGLNATTLRIGQICGDENGTWAVSDWVPILVKTSIALGCLPRANGTVAWLPLHAVTSCVLDLISEEEQCPSALNLVHPRRIAWDEVMEYIRDEFESVGKRRLTLVPFAKWIELLEQRGADAKVEDFKEIPGIKLLDFFRRLSMGGDIENSASGAEAIADEEQEILPAFNSAAFATSRAESFSSGLKLLRPLARNNVEQWITYWKLREFIQ